MKYIDALNILIARGVTAELVATTMRGESILMLTDQSTPAQGVMGHTAYAVSDMGVIEGSWLMHDEAHVAVHWDAQPYEALLVPFNKLCFVEANLIGLNNRLEARLKALT